MMASTARQPGTQPYFGDSGLLVCALLLLAVGLVMMTSASIEIADNQYGDPFYHLKRQLRFLVMGLCAAVTVVAAPLRYWRQGAVLLFTAAILLLVLVLIPGIGREVNGSTRWLNLGFMSIQASEPAKLFIVVFMAWLLSERNAWVCGSWTGFIFTLCLLVPPVFLLLLEPDFGAVVVLIIAVFGMMFMAGVKLFRFVLLCLLAGGGGVALILSSEYRLQRLQSFIQALSDPFSEDVVFGTGYQLAQALIAFGRGEWLGVGLGNSIQKLYFLPEAHTDFVLAIIAEELGFLAVLVLVGLFLAFLARALVIARRNEERGDLFAALAGYGTAFLFGGQILINMAVNVGLLPTKGLTLPFLSYGGSSLIVCLLMVGLLLRIDMENHYHGGGRGRAAGRGR